MSGTHVPVLTREVIDALLVSPGRRYIDATVGAGGHGWEIVKKGGALLGIDQDQSALEIAQKKLETESKILKSEKIWTLIHGNFRDIEKIAKEHRFTNVDGILFDLGVSSMQLDTPQRGFSYRFTDAPLDMRLDMSGGDTAAQLVNRISKEDLYDILSSYGEEQLAYAITDTLCSARTIAPIMTVGDVVRAVERVVSNEKTRHGVLARVFQGLRIAVNNELDNLKKGLEGTRGLLAPGGRLVVISFHSLEDRIVKLFMKHDGWQTLTSHPIRPTEGEVDTNSRSRSAKMRVAIKQNT